jgi:hypothetical protein
MSSFQVYNVTQSLIDCVVASLKGKQEVFDFEEDPLFASLCTCLGLKFELGEKKYDRLSPLLGVKLDDNAQNPYNIDIVTSAFGFGLQVAFKEDLEFKPLHKDFCHIFDSSSLDARGKLSRMVIFPDRIARFFNKRGLKLVIVRDWLLNSALGQEEDSQINYLMANEWEIERNIAMLQLRLMKDSSLAFSGTHDIADHLIGGDISGLEQIRGFVNESFSILNRVFPPQVPSRPQKLVLSYLMAVILDDLMQPAWYGSKSHLSLGNMILETIQSPLDLDHKSQKIVLPNSFHTLVALLRQNTSMVDIGYVYRSFVSELLS